MSFVWLWVVFVLPTHPQKRVISDKSENCFRFRKSVFIRLLVFQTSWRVKLFSHFTLTLIRVKENSKTQTREFLSYLESIEQWTPKINVRFVENVCLTMILFRIHPFHAKKKCHYFKTNFTVFFPYLFLSFCCCAWYPFFSWFAFVYWSQSLPYFHQNCHLLTTLAIFESRRTKHRLSIVYSFSYANQNFWRELIILLHSLNRK